MGSYTAGDFVSSLAFSPDGQMLASGGTDGKVILWDLSQDFLSSIQAAHLIDDNGGSVWPHVTFSPDGQMLAENRGDKVILWGLSSSEEPLRLTESLPGTSPMVFRPVTPPGTAGQMLVTNSASGDNIILWDLSNREAPGQLGRIEVKAADALAFSPDGRTLALGRGSHTAGDCVINLWDVSAPQVPRLLNELSCPPAMVTSLTFSPNGQILASGSDVDMAFFLWDVSNPETAFKLSGPIACTDWVNTVAFLPDGSTLVVNSEDNTFSLWDVSKSKSPSQLGGVVNIKEQVVKPSMALSPDGKTLALGDDQGNLSLWDISTPKAPRQLGGLLTGHKGYVKTVAFSPNGQTLASRSDFDTTTILWDLRLGVWQDRACRVANRNMTQEEWEQYVGDEAYCKTCPDLPSGKGAPQDAPACLIPTPITK